MPDDIDDYHLYVGIENGQPLFLDYDGDNGIHAFANEGLKQPYETRMRFLAVRIEPMPATEEDWFTILDWLDCVSYDALKGFETWFIDYAPLGGTKTMLVEFIVSYSTDIEGDVDEWLEDIIIKETHLE